MPFGVHTRGEELGRQDRGVIGGYKPHILQPVCSSPEGGEQLLHYRIEGQHHHEQWKIVRPCNLFSKVFGILLASSELIKIFGTSIASFKCGEHLGVFPVDGGICRCSHLVSPLLPLNEDTTLSLKLFTISRLVANLKSNIVRDGLTKQNSGLYWYV